VIVESVTATANSAIVARRSSSGESQPRLCSHARAPLAPAIAVMAHPAHIAPSYRRAAIGSLTSRGDFGLVSLQ
jgi:putative heme iron utilization protein